MSETKVHYKRTKTALLRVLSALLAAVLMLTAFPALENMALADSDGMIRVKLTRLGSSVTSVTMTTVGTYKVGTKTIPSGSTVKVTKSGSSLSLSAGGSQLASGTSITMSRTSGGTGSGVRFTSPALSNLFCGDLKFSISGSSIQTVLSIYIETYLYGVVPYEMSNSFPVEALKAQTIAARTYAMRAKRSSGSYDVTDNTSSQVFKGYNSSYTNAIAAVDGTRGVVLMSGGAYAQCYYTASNGGQTESTANAWGSSGISYLTVKDDPYDRENPNSIEKSYLIPKDPQKKSLNSSLKNALVSAAAGQLKEKGLSSSASDVVIEEIIAVEPHTPKYAAPSRTYTKLRFTMKLTSESLSTGNEVSTQVEVDLGTYSQLESMLSLSINSSDNEVVWVDEEDDGFRLSFGRYGHGIGLSQRGAQWMAKQYGMSYEEILGFYYPGTKQTQLSLNEIISGVETQPDPTRAPVQSEGGYTTLQEGDSGEAVKKLQIRLQELGYFTGTPLGNYKTLTVAAVKAYQKAMGLTQDGIATPELQKMIFSAAQSTPAPSATPAPQQTPAADETYAEVSLGSTSSKLNVRKGPSTSTAIAGTLRHGDKVTVLAVSGAWRQVTNGSLTGYVMAEYLKFVKPQATDTPEVGTGYTTLQYGDSGEAVRRLQEQLQKMGYFTGTPLGNYKTLTVAAVEAYQKAMDLTADGIATPELQEMIFAGQMPAATPAPAPVPTPAPNAGTSESVTAVVSLGSASSRLNVRKEASTSSSVVGTLKHGTKVTVISASGGWSLIKTSSLTGYVKSTYLAAASGPLPTEKPTATPAPQPTAKPEGTAAPGGIAVIKLNSSSSRLNVRKGPSTSTSIVGTLKHNTQVEVLEASGEWSRIRSGSLTGYVMTSYLSQSAAPAPETTPTQKPSTGGNSYTTLSYGDSGEAVKKLQARLQELGYFDGVLGGNYLKLTRSAVEAYQQANGWTVDGIATPELQKEIFEETNATANATVRVGSDSYLNLRKSASSSASVLAKMKNGTRVYVSGTSGDWYKVQTASGLTGYAKQDYIDMD